MCLNKMEAVGQHGRTAFFVSHNMNAITRLCGRAILLDVGQVQQDGPAGAVVTTYMRSGLGSTAAREWADADRAPGNAIVRLRAVRVRTEGEVADVVDIRQPMRLEMDYDVLQPGQVLVPNFHLHNEDGTCICIVAEVAGEWRRRPRPVGRYTSAVCFPGNFLAEGMVIVRAALSTHDPVAVHFDESDAVSFTVKDSLDGDAARGDYAGPMPGVVRPLLDWETTLRS